MQKQIVTVENVDILLIIPPLTQMNTPYPATAYLTGYLRAKGIKVAQVDLGLELLLELFSRKGIAAIVSEILKNKNYKDNESLNFFIESADDYASTIEPVIRFLQGRDPSLALRLANRQLVPEGARFLPLLDHPELLDFFGELGTQDKAKYIASLYIDDIADAIRNGVDADFELAKYGERLASSNSSFDLMYDRLTGPSSFIDNLLQKLVEEKFAAYNTKVIGMTCPFPGNVYSAFKIAQIAKNKKSGITTVLGGGYVNTELRSMTDQRPFEFIDELVFDDGEKAIELIIQKSSKRLRTMSLKNNKVLMTSDKLSPAELTDVAFKNHPGPDYSGLPLDRYFSMLEMPNVMHRMWSDFKWNKLILAHGCYWKKCTFCDISLDYIERFEPQKASHLVDQIEKVIAQTGTTGFHFVDEAAPPALLRQLSKELIARKIKITWWGNIRFDTLFDDDLAALMADAGCIAVTGGLEVASPRLLELIKKGISIDQVKKVTHAFKKAGIFVHAYLMYGFPSQTKKETIESLEVVRQLFANGHLDSAHWHRFVTTVHSPVGQNPDQYGISLVKPDVPTHGLFAQNQIDFIDDVKTNHDALGVGLRKALYNYMHGIGLETPAQAWFK
jgi:hypothetical protein